MNWLAQLRPIDVLTFILGLWGTIVSTVLGIRQLSQDKRQIRVSAEISLRMIPGVSTTPYLEIRATNTGLRPVVITNATLSLNNQLFFTPLEGIAQAQLPKRLEDGDPVSIFVKIDDIVNEVEAIRSKGHPAKLRKVIVTDSEENTYSCNLPRFFRENGLA